MILGKTTIKSAILLLFIFLVKSNICFAQEEEALEILSAKESYHVSNPEATQFSIGNIQLLHKGTLFYCDSAVYFEDRKLAKAYGDIHIKRGDSVDIFCKEIIYHEEEQRIEAYDSVVLRKDTVYLFTDEIEYHIQEERAEYTKGGLVVQNQDSIRSTEGVFLMQENLIEFQKNVNAKNPDQTSVSDFLSYEVNTSNLTQNGNIHIYNDSLDAKMDYLFYDASQDLIIGRGNIQAKYDNYDVISDSINIFTKDSILYAWDNIYVYDRKENFHLYSHFLKLNQKQESGIAYEDVLLYQVENIKDTTFIKGDTLYFNKKEDIEITCFPNVKLLREDVQCIADSMFLDKNKEKLYLHKDPIAWMDGQQVKADQIIFLFKEEKVDSLFLDGHVFLIQTEDSLKELYSQLKGRMMRIDMDSNRIQSSWVFGNVESLFCIKEKEEITGLHYMSGAELNLFFEEKELKEAQMLMEIEGKVTPSQKINEKNKYLSKFQLFPELQVKRLDFKRLEK
ncbi:MAG: hypothetical protein N4A45_02340 [Flavobacteriales bacterium]|jgi:lipopolysaccharide assembly outer membrane protein LptD (OstA)|nr:hypothetical protein [Flavobacteriales bacterium]